MIPPLLQNPNQENRDSRLCSITGLSKTKQQNKSLWKCKTSKKFPLPQNQDAMRRNGSLRRNGSTQNQKWVKSQPKMLVASQRWSRTGQRAETKARRGSRPLLTTPEREPWSRQNLKKRQNDPKQQLVHHHQSEKVGEAKLSGGCGILIVRGLLLIFHTLYWVSSNYVQLW